MSLEIPRSGPPTLLDSRDPSRNPPATFQGCWLATDGRGVTAPFRARVVAACSRARARAHARSASGSADSFEDEQLVIRERGQPRCAVEPSFARTKDGRDDEHRQIPHAQSEPNGHEAHAIGSLEGEAGAVCIHNPVFQSEIENAA